MGALVLRLGTGRWRTCSRKRRKVRVLRSFQTSPQRSMTRTFDSPSIPSRHEGLQWFIHLEMGRYTHIYIHILYVYYIYMYIYIISVCVFVFIYIYCNMYPWRESKKNRSSWAERRRERAPKTIWWLYIHIIYIYTYIYSTNPWYHGNDGYILCTFCWWYIYIHVFTVLIRPYWGGPTWIDFDEG